MAKHSTPPLTRSSSPFITSTKHDVLSNSRATQALQIMIKKEGQRRLQTTKQIIRQGMNITNLRHLLIAPKTTHNHDFSANEFSIRGLT